MPSSRCNKLYTHILTFKSRHSIKNYGYLYVKSIEIDFLNNIHLKIRVQHTTVNFFLNRTFT